MLQEWGGGQFLQSIHEAVGSTEKTLSRGFCPPPMGNGLEVQKLPAACCRDWGVSVGGNPLGPAALSPVLPLDDPFDQPTIQTLDDLADEPSMASLDALATDPTPLLDALEEMAATNDRFLMLLI